MPGLSVVISVAQVWLPLLMHTWKKSLFTVMGFFLASNEMFPVKFLLWRCATKRSSNALQTHSGYSAEKKAKSKLTYAEAQLARVSTLARGDFASQQALDQATNDVAAARSDVAEAEANHAATQMHLRESFTMSILNCRSYV